MANKKFYAELREAAEKLLSQREMTLRVDTETDLLRILHELEVHQVELELQNEELQRIRGDLEESRNEYLTLYNSAPASFMSIDSKGSITKANRKAEDMFSNIGGSLIKTSIMRLIYPSDYEVYLRFLNQVETHSKSFCNLRMTGRSGNLLHVRMEETSRLDAEGSLQRDFVIIDMTRQKKAEDALRQLNENLEQQVAERTILAELRAAQLQALSIELIDTEERERRQIAHILHDDLQQMLAAAKLRLQMVSHSMPNELALVDIDLILKDSIEKSRNLSHELSPPVLHHSGLIGALQWLGLRMDEQFDLKVDLEVAEEPIAENASLKRFLFRSVQELLFNTVKHSGVNHARIALSSSNGEIKISVSDEGRGFDPNTLNKIDAGFGLMTIRERASYIGGSLDIDSIPGKGSRCTIIVPISSAIIVERSGQNQATLQPSRGVVVSTSKLLRVLFADDHHIMRKGLVNMVKGNPNIEVVGEAANGQEAFEQSLQLRPDVVVMDISMPVMNGIEATRLIKAELPDVRVIGLSMHADEQSAKSILGAGADDFITKTASPKEFLQAIFGLTLDKDPQS